MVQCEAPRGKGIQGQRETEEGDRWEENIQRCIENERERGDKAIERERIFIGLMTSDRKLKASREGSK